MHNVEGILSNKYTLEKLIEAEPTLKDKILSFFKGASEDYAGDPGLSRAARRYYKTYKKLFDEFSARNFQNNATENSHRNSEISSDGKHHALNDSDVDNSADSRYNYTKEQYEKFGWARANDVLSETENARLRSLFADAVSKQSNPPKTKSGEYMIAVGEDVDNKIAYMTGKIDDPVITRILEIYEYDETTLSKRRKEINVFESRGIRAKTGGIYRLYSSADYGYQQYKQRISGQGTENNNQLGAERGTGSRATEKTQGGVRRSFLPVVHTFTDISGKKRNVLKVGQEFMIEGNNHAKYAPTIEDAVRAENSRVIDRYARKHNTTAGRVKQKLATDPDFLKNERDSGKRFALNDSDVDKNVEIEYNESHDLYTATDAFYEEVHHVDRSSFSRSLANRTTGMKKGETRTLMILGSSSRAYCFRADGYMHGNMIKSFLVKNRQILEDIANEYDKIDKSAEDASLWAEDVQSVEGRRDSYSGIYGRRRSDSLDRLHQKESERDGTRDSERERQNYRTEKEYEELIRRLREMYGFPESPHDGSKRFALSETRESIMTEVDPEYKPTVQDKVFSGWTASQIAFTNAQAGIETVGRSKYGIKKRMNPIKQSKSVTRPRSDMERGRVLCWMKTVCFSQKQPYYS